MTLMWLTFAADVPTSPLWRVWLFEDPWWLAIGFAVVGLGCRIVARRVEPPLRPRLSVAGLVAFAVAIGVFLLAWGVTTDRERVIERTRSLARALSTPVDVAVIDDIAAEPVTVAGADGRVWFEVPKLSALAAPAIRNLGITRHTVLDLDVGTEGDTAVACLSVTSDAEQGYGPGLSKWRLGWAKRDGRWRVVEVRCLEINGRRANRGDLPISP